MTVNELLAAATAAMKSIHEGLAQASDGCAALIALDTPENAEGLDEKTVRAFRREVGVLQRTLSRTADDADDAHAALNAVALADSVVSPQFGK